MPIFGSIHVEWNRVRNTSLVAPQAFSREILCHSYFAIMWLVCWTECKQTTNTKGKECGSVMSSHFFGGNVARHSKKWLQTRPSVYRFLTSQKRLRAYRVLCKSNASKLQQISCASVSKRVLEGTLSYENKFSMQFLFHANQSHFQKHCFALRLALKQRPKGTRKWPICTV